MNEGIAPEKGIKGIKGDEWVSPEKILPDVPRSELPAGVRAYLKANAFDLAKKKIIVNLYELRDEPGDLKVDRVHLEKLSFIPDEDYIGLHYGPSKDGYIWMGKWQDEAGEKGLVSETIYISEKWRRRYEEHQRKLGGQAREQAPGDQVATVAAAPAFGPLEMMKLLQAGEDRAFQNMERMAKIMQGTKNETPAEVMAAMSKGMGDMMLESVEGILKVHKTVANAARNSIEDITAPAAPAAAAAEPEEAEAGFKMPSWLEPFMPHIEKGIEKLLGGGPVGSAVKTLILSSDEWEEIFNDKEKWGIAVAAMEKKFGTKRTSDALDRLLNRRPEVKPKGKGK